MAQYYNEPDEIEEEEVKPEHAEFLKHLRGVSRIVINKQHGGFALSHEATIVYLEMTDTPYELRPQPDRHSQERYGSDIYVNGEYFHSRLIPRDDPALVSVVKKMGEAASGEYCELKVVTIPGDVDWAIEEYDGLEWVAEKHRIWR